MVGGACNTELLHRAGKVLEIRHNLQTHDNRDLPPSKPHLLKFLEPPKIALPAENQVFNT
jgi:hypothetical protein